jgi:hypothetical protein
MANQTIPRHAAFFKEQRDLRQEARNVHRLMHSLQPRTLDEATQIMQLYVNIGMQLVFHATLLAQGEEQQHNPFIRQPR